MGLTTAYLPQAVPECLGRLPVRGLGAAKVGAVVLLAGGVRSSRFETASGRSLLDLPVLGGSTVLDLWRAQIERLGDLLGLDRLVCRILLRRIDPEPRLGAASANTTISVERDATEFRGTGGLLRDLALGYEDSARLLVASATQLPLEPVERCVGEALSLGSPIVLLQDATGSPTSLFLIACEALRRIPEVGFVDLKEQGLPLMTAHHSVSLIHCPGPMGAPIRTAADYLRALRLQSWRNQHGSGTIPPFAECWRSDFALVEPEAVVHPSALLHNAVVLDGAMVGAGAVVVNSVVCPGAKARPGSRLVNQLLTARGAHPVTEQ